MDLSKFQLLENVLKEQDKDAVPIPLVLSGTTDARFFNKLNIQTYGFTPMDLPGDFAFSSLIHSNNERIPISSLCFGIKALERLLINYK